MPDSHQLDDAPPPPADQSSAAPAAANAQPNPVALPFQVPVKPKMIIKGVLGRYERWNPVHPTAGAFWGMGLGLGCGVGWGPGFGPEVIGYVGAGCGVGFSVGFTIAGVGIGLPQHVLVKNYDNSGFPSNVSLESARSYTMTIIRGLVADAISSANQVGAVRKGVSKFQDSSQVPGGVDLPKLGKGSVK
ncbi:hypothetical protein EJB05_14645 [Eragrostis curvula]|uniref:Cadmium-induced protein AS8 n=1 Tax=Eragrostis curvula TaxID=38414 RepID=A0A5J9VZR6_9POAL|nr:hypothetical protein EJB05_14645 [Eragrostis curvula]